MKKTQDDEYASGMDEVDAFNFTEDEQLLIIRNSV